MGRKPKEIGLKIRMPKEKCSREEMLYMRARYIAMLLKWEQDSKSQEQH